MQKITPFLWFDNNAEEAVSFYASVFKDCKVKEMLRYGAEGPGPAGQVMTTSFELFGQEFVALNGGPMFRFTEAVSFVINCQDQAEVDYYWERLSEGGQKSMCGWLKDRFGLSWQVVPVILDKLLADKDAERAQSVMRAMMKMTKLDIAELRRAYDEPVAA